MGYQIRKEFCHLAVLPVFLHPEYNPKPISLRLKSGENMLENFFAKIWHIDLFDLDVKLQVNLRHCFNKTISSVDTSSLFLFRRRK